MGTNELLLPGHVSWRGREGVEEVSESGGERVARRWLYIVGHVDRNLLVSSWSEWMRVEWVEEAEGRGRGRGCRGEGRVDRGNLGKRVRGVRSDLDETTLALEPHRTDRLGHSRAATTEVSQ